MLPCSFLQADVGGGNWLAQNILHPDRHGRQAGAQILDPLRIALGIGQELWNGAVQPEAG